MSGPAKRDNNIAVPRFHFKWHQNSWAKFRASQSMSSLRLFRMELLELYSHVWCAFVVKSAFIRLSLPRKQSLPDTCPVPIMWLGNENYCSKIHIFRRFVCYAVRTRSPFWPMQLHWIWMAATRACDSLFAINYLYVLWKLVHNCDAISAVDSALGNHISLRMYTTCHFQPVCKLFRSLLTFFN